MIKSIADEKGVKVEITGNKSDNQREIASVLEGLKQLPFMTKKRLLKLVEVLYES